MKPLDLRLCSCGLDLDRCLAPRCPAYEPDRPETQFEVCPACDGEGEVGTGVMSHTVNSATIDPPWEVTKTCPECDGRGDVEVPT